MGQNAQVVKTIFTFSLWHVYQWARQDFHICLGWGPCSFPPEKKKKKKDQPLHELSQTRTSWPRSQIVCSAVFLTSKHSVFLHKGFHGHVEFLMQKKVGETETLFPTEWVIGKKKKWEGRRKRKHFLHVPSPHPNLSNPKSNMVAQWMVLSSLVKCLCWKKVFGVFVKGPSPHKKRQLNIFVSVRQ